MGLRRIPLTVWATLAACCAALAVVFLSAPADPPPASKAEPDAATSGAAAPEALMLIELAAWPSAHIEGPRWSPDGRQIAYEFSNVRNDSHRMDGRQWTRETWIVSVASDGHPAGGPVQVTATQPGARTPTDERPPLLVDLAWAPKSVASKHPYVVSVSNRAFFLGGDWLIPDGGESGHPDWSPDGRFIAFTSQRQDSADIYVIEVGGPAASPRRLTLRSSEAEMRPKWGPRGHSLLYTRVSSDDGGQDIGVIEDTDRPEVTLSMVTQMPGDESRPTWSPDGRQIAFYSNRGLKLGSDSDLWICQIECGHPKKLAGNVVVGEWGGPQWSPDGTTIFFVGRSANRKVPEDPIMWVRADGSFTGRVQTGTRMNSDLALHGAGDRIRLAFTSTGETNAEEEAWRGLYLVEFEMIELEGWSR